MGLFDALLGNDSGGGQALSLTGTTAPAAPSFVDRLNNPLSQIGLALMANSGRPTTEGGPMSSVAQGLQNYSKIAQKNKTEAWLKQYHPDVYGFVQAGMDPGQAFVYALRRDEAAKEDKRNHANDAFARSKFEWEKTQGNEELDLRRQTLQQNSATSDMKEYQYATEHGFQGSFYDWQTKKATAAAGGEKFGVSPLYGRDRDGNIVILQPGDRGTVKRSDIPDGIQPLSPEELNFGKAAGTAGGKVAGEEKAAASAVLASASAIDDQITALKNDPGLSSILGPIDSRTPNFFSGATGAQAKLDQLKGQAFMQARQLLKGGGQITDFEGKKAEQAMARLDQAQSIEDFTKALDDFNEAVQTGARRIAEQAGGGGSAGGASGTSGSIGWRVK